MVAAHWLGGFLKNSAINDLDGFSSLIRICAVRCNMLSTILADQNELAIDNITCAF